MSTAVKILMLDLKVMTMVSKILEMDLKVMAMKSKVMMMESKVVSVSFHSQRRGDVEPRAVPSAQRRAPERGECAMESPDIEPPSTATTMLLRPQSMK
jgi:hypothetical protein